MESLRSRQQHYFPPAFVCSPDLLLQIHLLYFGLRPKSGRQDSNLRPLSPEPSALAKLSYAPFRFVILSETFGFFHRTGGLNQSPGRNGAFFGSQSHETVAMMAYSTVMVRPDARPQRGPNGTPPRGVRLKCHVCFVTGYCGHIIHTRLEHSAPNTRHLRISQSRPFLGQAPGDRFLGAAITTSNRVQIKSFGPAGAGYFYGAFRRQRSRLPCDKFPRGRAARKNCHTTIFYLPRTI